MHCLTNFVNNLREGIPRDSPSRMSRLNVLDIAQLSKTDPQIKKKEKLSTVKKKKGTRSKPRATTAIDDGKTKKRKDKEPKSDKKRKRGKSPSNANDSPKYPKSTQQLENLELAPRTKGVSMPTIPGEQISKLSKDPLNSKTLPILGNCVKAGSEAEEKHLSQNPTPIISPHISPHVSPRVSPKSSPKASPKSSTKITTKESEGKIQSLDLPSGSLLRRTSTETVIVLNLTDSDSNSSDQEVGFEECDQEFNTIAKEINLLLDCEESTESSPQEKGNSKYEQVIVSDDPIEEKKTENIVCVTDQTIHSNALQKPEGELHPLNGEGSGAGTAETKEIVDNNNNKAASSECNNIQSPKIFEGKKFKYELKQTILDSEEDDESDDDVEEEDDESDEPRMIPSCSLMEYDVIINDKKTPLEVIYSICKLSSQLNEMIGGAICPANSNIEQVGENQWQVKVKWALPMENFALPAAPDPNALAIWILEVLPPVKPEEMAARRGVFVDLDWSIFSNLSKQAIAAHK